MGGLKILQWKSTAFFARQKDNNQKQLKIMKNVNLVATQKKTELILSPKISPIWDATFLRQKGLKLRFWKKDINSNTFLI